MGDFEGKAEQLIPATVRMISGCCDHQTSADVSNVSQFQLPDPAGECFRYIICGSIRLFIQRIIDHSLPDRFLFSGQSGGACTSALLKVLYADHKNSGKDMSFVEVLTTMRQFLGNQKYTQIPQLSSSRKMDVTEKFAIVPSGSSGSRRALLIGINYIGQQGQLSGCHNDASNIKDYLMDVHGFKDEDITVLMDDGKHENPTYDNIISAFRTLVSQTEAGDCAFLHYSGE